MAFLTLAVMEGFWGDFRTLRVTKIALIDIMFVCENVPVFFSCDISLECLNKIH